MRDKLREAYDRHLAGFMPSQKALSLIFVFLLNCVVYWGAMLINKNRALMDINIVLDRALPFDSRWVVIYLGSFLFWIINYILLSQTEDWYRIMTAEVTAKLLCGLIFLLLPSTNVRPEHLGSGIWDALMGAVYAMDEPTNLFPSIHCLESWICYGGLRKRLDIPEWYRDFSGVFAIMVCLSTLFTKQHVVADVFAGVFLAEGVLYLSKKRHWGGRASRWTGAVDRWIFHRAE